ncbi:MAG TPA: hypothetical protein VGR35_01910 [Tepidisphaeraceae bacterium]|nr:hypothetical protein [Tepidisphaeraceae bacterium]
MIRFHCTCKHAFETDDNMAGGLVQCPECGKLNDIPTLSDLHLIAEDGTYRMDAENEEQAANRLGELKRAFARSRVDEYGAEIDLRPTMQDIRDAGVEEIPLEFKDEARPGAPKYDPVTGELIRPMDVRERTPADGAVPAIAVQNKTLKYASRDMNVVTNGFEIIGQMFALPNVIVMLVIFLSHLFMQVMTYATVFFILLFPIYLFLIGLFIAHYANTIDETGPEARDELPRPLRNVSWHDDMWGPFFNVMLAFGFAYGPGLACLLLDVPAQIRLTLAGTLALIGTLVFPAILLTTTTSGSVLNLRPDRVLGVIRHCGIIAYPVMLVGWIVSIGIYLFAVVGTMVAVDTFFFGGSPGTAVRQVLFHWAVQYPLLLVGIFLMHAYAWYLGLQYRKHHADFPWVLQRYTGRRGAGAAAPRQGFAVLHQGNEAAAARAKQPKASATPRVAPRPVQALPEPPETGNRG